MQQRTLATAGFERYAKTTRWARFLAEMARGMPWAALCRSTIAEFLATTKSGRITCIL
jgi:hypothetical protein